VVYVVRIAELVILAVLAPLALALAAHPTGWSVARSWWAEALAVTSLQTVQAVLLSTFTLMIRETPSLTALPMTLATSVALAYLVLRLPGWLRVWSHSSFHSDPGQLWRSLRHLL
jgi:hypothetical protein